MKEAAKEEELSWIPLISRLTATTNTPLLPTEVTSMQVAASWVTTSEEEEKV